MAKRGKIYSGCLALLRALFLCLCLFLAGGGGRYAEAAPERPFSSEPVGRTATAEQAVLEDGDEYPYGSGRAGLKVTSSPEGAEVYLGARPLGVTPWTGADLPAGRFTLRLRLPKHLPVDEPVELVAGSTIDKSYRLLPGYGRLTVLSSPPGAKVFLDGIEQKGKTPTDLTEVPAGTHLVKVHLDRYHDAEQRLTLTVNSAERVRFDLRGGNLEACGDKWLEPEAAARCRAEEEERRQVALIGEFVNVPGGCFQMGDTHGDGWSDERPVHEVCVDGFTIGKFEVTQGQWLAVMGKNPSYFKKGDNFPVEQVSWTEAQNFITKLNAITGRRFRLPSEAEWEFAARSGGRQEKYAGGDNPGSLAWYDANSGPSTHAVGTRQPNGLGIHDMSGNVGEWVQDWYDSEYYRLSPRNNPVGPLSGATGRVIRGGSWNVDSGLIRVANRDRYEPSNRFAAVGFRLAYSSK